MWDSVNVSPWLLISGSPCGVTTKLPSALVGKDQSGDDERVWMPSPMSVRYVASGSSLSPMSKLSSIFWTRTASDWGFETTTTRVARLGSPDSGLTWIGSGLVVTV